MRNGPHDIGGAPGFGPVLPGGEELAYPEGWEGSCIAAIIASIGGGAFNTDEFRARMEELPPAAYWSMGYYRRWLHTLEANLVAHDALTRAQIDQHAAALVSGAGGAPTREDPELLAAIDRLLDHGAPLHRRVDALPRFAVGDRVRTRTIHVARPGEDHTRLPGYVQDRPGIVERQYPAMTLPDRHVHGEDRAEYLYAVSFAVSELWEDGDTRARVSADLFESYLEPEED